MTPAEAAWVRDHAWLPSMRRRLWGGPDGYTRDAELAARHCACDTRICSACSRDEHQFCDRRRRRPWPEWWIENRPLDYIRPTPVWYADRACRSLCPCCPAGLPRPAPVFELVPLFDVAATP